MKKSDCAENFLTNILIYCQKIAEIFETWIKKQLMLQDFGKILKHGSVDGRVRKAVFPPPGLMGKFKSKIADFLKPTFRTLHVLGI